VSTLTTGNDDEGMVQTVISGAGPAQLNASQTLFDDGTPLGPFGGTPVAPAHPCVPSVLSSSSLPSGHIAASVNGGKFGAPFVMNADFSNPIPCNGVCGEYRQFVSGFFSLNGTDVVHALCGNSLSRTTEHEDCLTSGGTTLKYGYHSIAFTNSQFSNPDQATGSSFRGRDAPGFRLASLSSGDVLNFSLSFRGVLVDACDSDRALSTSSWTAGGSHTVA
jgi:hypothetical protein